MNLAASNMFQSLDFGTKVSTDKLEVVEVKIDPITMTSEYASATLLEMQRMNPVKMESLQTTLTVEALSTYFAELVNLRIAQVLGKKIDWRAMKQLHMPAWIQFTLESIGEVILVDQGLRFIPAENETWEPVDMKALYAMSDLLRGFERDGLSVVSNGFKPSRDGDPETMTLCILDGYVKGLASVQSHPVHTYVAAFLGQKIVQEQAFRVLYRIRYDDVQFIAQSLLHESSLFRSSL